MNEALNLGAVLDASPNLYMLLDRELRYVWANAAYVAATGSSLESLIGRHVFDAFPNDPGDPNNESARLLRQSFEKVLATRQRDVVAYIPYRVPRSQDGTHEMRYWSATHTPILGAQGEVRYVLQHTVDVTELQRLRAERRGGAPSEELTAVEAGVLGRAEQVQAVNRELGIQLDDFRRLFGQAPGFACFLRGPQHVFEIANAAYLTMIGERDILGRPIAEALPEVVGQGFVQILDRVFRTGEAFIGRGIRVVFEGTRVAQAKEIYVDFVYQPIADAAGTVFGIFVQGNDITLQKQLEAEREHLLRAEQSARGEAERANRLKDEFLATVSHELRTPLNAMLGWVQMLRAGTLPPDRQARALETIERNARAQAGIIEDILDVSRIMNGKLQLEPERLDLAAVVEAAVESVRPSAQAKGVRLAVAVAGPAPLIGDASRLQQVTWNLLSNAVKFTPQGGAVEVRVRTVGGEVEVAVQDTGTGIAPDFLPHVFERFRQAEGSRSRSHGGLGLGLAIVKQIVELHGGRVWAESEGPGRGALFSLRLPAATEWADKHPRRSAAAVGGGASWFPLPALAGRRLLIVDDDPDARELVREMLRGAGLHVQVAGSAAEAMRFFRQEPPDLLLSDVGMPGEDGFALLRQVRSLPSEKGGRTPAVALTAYARAEDRTQALLAGFRAHVPKPVDPRELLAVLASVLPQGDPEGAA